MDALTVVVVLAFVAALAVLAVWSACAVAGRCDEDADRMYRDILERRKGGDGNG